MRCVIELELELEAPLSECIVYGGVAYVRTLPVSCKHEIESLHLKIHLPPSSTLSFFSIPSQHLISLQSHQREFNQCLQSCCPYTLRKLLDRSLRKTFTIESSSSTRQCMSLYHNLIRCARRLPDYAGLPRFIDSTIELVSTQFSPY